MHRFSSTACACALVSVLLAVGCEDPVEAPADAGARDAFVAPRPDAGRDAGPPPDDSPYKGPLVLRPTPTSVRVRWESRLSPTMVAVDVTPEGGGAMTTHTGASRETVTMLSYGIGSPIVREPDVPGTYYVNDVSVEGLTPATCYTYEIVGWPTEGGRFCTMHEATDADTPITFYAIGDTAPAVMGTVRLITEADPAQTEFSIHVGDIQYYSTVIESQQVWFGLMEPMLRANAFMPCIGNHEDELEHEFDDIYLRLFGGANEDGTDLWYHYQTGGVPFISLSSEHEFTLGSEQHDWLMSTLARIETEPGYRFTVIYIHRPVYSLGDFRPNLAQREALSAATSAYSVPLVLAGHMHGYERFELDGVTYITTGAGGFVDVDISQQAEEFPELAAARVASGSFL